MSKVITTGITILLIFVVLMVVFQRASITQAPTPTPTATPAQSDDVHVFSLQAGDAIVSPLVIQGEARGTWSFEASFPIHLLDGDGNEIISVPAQLEGDWMTTEFVPFTATLVFEKPATSTGTLVFQKDNPSGLPEYDKSISIPIRFK